jgi:urate oxidase
LRVATFYELTGILFAFVKNNSPSNTCTLGYGTIRAYVYSVFTHPDGTAIVPTDSLSNAAVDESFNVTPACAKFGNAIINTNAEFVDNVASCASKPLTCSQTLIQTLKVAGYVVRTNQLVFSSSGVGYTNEGPTQ